MNARSFPRVGFVVLLALVWAVPAAPQVVGGVVGGPPAQQRPGIPSPRDPREQRPQVGTASLTGRVVAADTGTPLRRAQVRVSGQDLRGARSAMTDGEGRYTVGNLPAGRYSISFMKGGFANMSYGQKRPNQPGKSVDLLDGQKMENLDVSLIRGGVVTGRIVDDFGEPIVDARVQVLQLRWFNGRRRMAGGGRGNQTNDRGEYRIWGLGPGEYYVSATSTDRQMFSDPQLASLDATDSSGFAATYFPGTASVDEAQKVSVAAGQEVSGVDFALVTTRVVRVSGTAMASDGRPMANAMVMMVSRGAMEMGGMMMSLGGRTDSDGSFVIPNVAPGEYVLQARAEGGPRGMRGGGEGASTTVSVGTEDVKNVMLVATKGVRVSGRVIFEGSTPTAEVKDRSRVFLPPIEREGFMGVGESGDAQVTPEGTFEVRGVSGRRTFSVSAGPPWMVKSARIGGTDVLDSGYEFGKEDVTNVEIVLTSRAPALTGSVTGENNSPVSDYVVVAFSTNEESWERLLGGMGRGFSIGRPDQNGTYKVTGIRPGSYYVVALPEMPEELGNPDLFKALKERAKQVKLQEGETERLDLVLQQAPGT
ncbi:MAG TPA: carboxypeptidase-like regulatory domain-containing protein [Bryobacteraceae bacterium]|nr:carboxypeptidase-like regulatory domain-containing protein [Bryobacteraceae bacterium]